jgi:hypothetical protein
MRELGPGAFPERFPLWKNVEELIESPTFDLEKERLTVKIAGWTGEIQLIGELADVWVTVKGIPPKWCAWGFNQSVTALGSAAGEGQDLDDPG